MSTERRSGIERRRARERRSCSCKMSTKAHQSRRDPDCRVHANMRRQPQRRVPPRSAQMERDARRLHRDGTGPET